jgi:hypothetical protein
VDVRLVPPHCHTISNLLRIWAALWSLPIRFSREIMARERSDAAAVESMAATGAGYRRREDASPGRPGTAKRFSVCEGAIVVLTIGGTMVHAKIVKMEQSSLLGSSKQRRSAKRNTRDAFEARRQRRASAARAMADSVPPGLGLEQQMEQRQMEEEVVQQQQRQQQRTKAKRAAVGDEGASPPAPRRQRVQVAQRAEVVVTAAVPRVMCGRERVVEVTPAVKVARRGPEDDAASAGVAARERRRQDERDAILLGKSDEEESARSSDVVYVFT